MERTSILVIDDDHGILSSLSSVFDDDYRIFTASGCREGFSIIASNPIFLILLDLNMPDMNGVEFLNRLRKAGKNIPVLVMTGSSNHEWAKKCADLNVQGYIEKPFNTRMLLRRIDKLLNRESFDMLSELWGENYNDRIKSINPTVRKALGYIRDNYKKDFSRENVAEYAYVSVDHLSRQFHKECGIHMKDYVNMVKICRCKAYLKNQGKSAEEAAKSVGITDVNYLYRLFKKYTGQTIQEFRKKNVQL